MQRSLHATANPDGTFTEGNPSTSTPATILTADVANAMMQELANYIESRAITLNPADSTQLTAAIQDHIGTVGAGAFRNALINPKFGFWTRVDPTGGASTLPTGGIAPADFAVAFVDRWYCTAGGGGAGTIERQAFALGQTDVEGEPEYYLEFDQSSAATTSDPAICQAIEGVRTAAGRKLTVTFNARVSSGTLTPTAIDVVQFFGSGGSGDVVSSSALAITSPIIDTDWNRFEYSITVPSISGATITSDDFLMLRLRLPQGSTFTLHTTQIQAEVRPVQTRATSFEVRPSHVELGLCRRYCEKSVEGEGDVTSGLGDAPKSVMNHNGSGIGSSVEIAGISYQEPKRIEGLGASGGYHVFYNTDGTKDEVQLYQGATALTRALDSVVIRGGSPVNATSQAAVTAGVYVGAGHWICDVEFNHPGS